MKYILSALTGIFLLLATGALAQDDSATVELAPDMQMGQADAPVTVIEYASYTCPHCARFHEEVFPLLKSEYIDTGKVLFIHREIFFDRFGLWAAMLARCGDGTRYFGMNDLIYGTQRDWLGSREPQEVVANLRKMGILAGLEADQITACLEDRELAQSLIAAFQTHADADGIDSTPTFIIDGEKYPNMAWADMKAIIEEKLAAKAQ
ncbi:MAG TPA: DsbA family protein [Aliiroseovarius sp.]|nr:DsbA family protein [Aliiroseovarius sp.]